MNYIEKVDNIRNKYNVFGFLTLEVFEDEINEYKELIPDFFSRDGESKGIRTVYEKTKDPSRSELKLNAIDLQVAESTYNEYLEGMIQFIKDIDKCVTENTDYSEYEDKLNTAKCNDKLFIESIFGGKNNPEHEFTAEEVAKDLEILVDFIPKLDEVYKTCNKVEESVTSNNMLVLQSLSMMYESVSDFFCNEIKGAMNNYYKLYDAVNKDTSASSYIKESVSDMTYNGEGYIPF